VCTGSAENKRAWCSMLRDMFSTAGQRGIVQASAVMSNETVNSICANERDQCLESQRLLGYQQGKKGFGAPADACDVLL
jgi:hypothetical protein